MAISSCRQFNELFLLAIYSVEANRVGVLQRESVCAGWCGVMGECNELRSAERAETQVGLC